MRKGFFSFFSTQLSLGEKTTISCQVSVSSSEKMPRLPSQDILRAFALEIYKNKKSHDISANSCLDCIIIWEEAESLPEQGVISMKSCEMEPRLRAYQGGGECSLRPPDCPAASGAAPPGPAAGSWGQSQEPSFWLKPRVSFQHWHRSLILKTFLSKPEKSGLSQFTSPYDGHLFSLTQKTISVKRKALPQRNYQKKKFYLCCFST